MDEQREVPVLVRRRRKVARQHREKTPEPTRAMLGTKPKQSEQESCSSSANEQNRPSISRSSSGAQISGHKSKILYRRSFNTAANRSQSTPRPEEAIRIPPENRDYESFMNIARRSLSTPRHKDESSESRSSSIRLQEQEAAEYRKQFAANRTDDKNLTRHDRNLKRFEEERRRFELEKKRFEREKRELEKIRYKKLEELEFKDKRRIFEGYSSKKLLEKKKNDIINDDEEKRRLINDFKQAQALSSSQEKRKDPPKPPPRYIDYESSTVSSSDEAFGGYTPSENPEESDICKIETAKVTPPQLTERKVSKPETNEGTNDGTNEKAATEETIPSISNGTAPADPKIQPKKERFVAIKDFITAIKFMFRGWRYNFKLFVKAHPNEVAELVTNGKKCFADLIIIMIFCGFGGLTFRFVEGSMENTYKCGVNRVKRDFIDQLWYSSHNLREEDWKSLARNKLRTFESELYTAFESGLQSNSASKVWSFINSVVFCFSVISSIGYGHIAPVTFPGRIITIIYSIIGIPLFLILLADFGKMFTRSIKFMWAFVRRLYYTGSCRRVRKNSQVQGVLKGIGMAYDVARKHSMMMNGPPTVDELAEAERQTNITDPTTPIPQEMLIDDEFNLPISLAIFILISYELVGAILYAYAENWSIMDSFYFVFISMSTIGFGDIVPSDPIAMVLSIAYLAFGLALTSMCINVVQLKLTDSFRHATLKLSHTIGLGTPDMGEFDENGEEGTEIDSNHLNVPPVLILKDPPTAPMRKKSRVESPTEISLSSRDT